MRSANRMANAPRVELVYDAECPNVERARAALRAALLELGARPAWTEWDRDHADTPGELRRYGSPTVLVDGRDVGCAQNEDTRADASSCRVYLDECGCLRGAPPARLIVNAIRGAGPA